MAIEGSTIEFVRFFVLWAVTMLVIYMPHLWREVNPDLKVNLNLTHITIILPVLLNAIARGTRQLNAFAVDWAFLLLALAVTFLFVYTLTLSNKVNESVRDFGKNKESTGTTLALSLTGFFLGIFISRLAYDGAMYRHAYA